MTSVLGSGSVQNLRLWWSFLAYVFINIENLVFFFHAVLYNTGTAWQGCGVQYMLSAVFFSGFHALTRVLFTFCRDQEQRDEELFSMSILRDYITYAKGNFQVQTFIIQPYWPVLVTLRYSRMQTPS